MNVFSHEISADGVILRLSAQEKNFLSTKSTLLKVTDWSSSGDKNNLRALTAIGPIIQELDDLDTDTILVTHKKVAAFSESESLALGLPISMPYQLRVWSSGNWLDNTNDLNSEFLDAGKPILIDKRIGAFAFIGRLKYRIPEPLFSIICEVVSFPSDRDGKIEAQARIAGLLGANELSSNKLDAEEPIANIKIRHVAGFSASVGGSLDDPNLSPVLFAKFAVESSADSGEILDETQQILDQTQSASFRRQFSKAVKTQPTYVLSSGEYVYIDPSVRPAFSAFHEITKSDPAKRRSFLQAPNAVMAAQLSKELDDPESIIELAFVQTVQFSDRVIGVNKWEVPDLPWLAKEGNEWGTDILVF